MHSIKSIASSLKPKIKPQGSALLLSILLSGLMLTVGIMSARLAVREVQLSADLFLSEKAYFSAESGVEKSLWLLKSQPLAHVETTNDIALGGINTEVSIRNLINTTAGDFPSEEFSFTLPPLQSQKFRFRQDTDVDVTTTEAEVTGTVKIDLDSSGDFFWRFLCQDTAGVTQSLQKSELGASSLADITNILGKTDDGVDTNFNAWTGVEKDTCYLSVQNLSSADREFTFSGTEMAPHAAHIHSVGRHEGREKHIRFDYAQKTLGSLFDFSFLHSEDGL